MARRWRFIFPVIGLVAFPAINPALAASTDVAGLQVRAEQGDSDAQLALGDLYARGQDMTQDYVRAHKWFNLAAAAGSQKAAGNRDLFSQLMTKEQIAEAQKLAREWFARHRGGEQ